MTIKELILKQEPMTINEWLDFIKKNGLGEYEKAIITTADYFGKITINEKADFIKTINI